ncbi:hypothetical protein VN97_g2575, partial [Penicillium thymicola]
MNPSGY